MTNREQLNNTAVIDMLDMINKRNSCIVHRLGGTADKKQCCKKFICCYDCIAAWLNEECKMNKEEYEIRIERYQTIIEDLYAALYELKQKNEQNEAEIRRLIDCIKRNSEEECN